MARRDTVNVALDGKIVSKYNILTTDFFVHAVYEPSSSSGSRPWSHSTISSGSDFGVPGWVGRVGTRDLPVELDAMPSGESRYKAVTAFQQAQYDEAYALIVRAFPDAAHGRRSMGDITTHEPVK